MNLKVQPHSEEAEKALLGSVLKGGSETFEKCKHWIRQYGLRCIDYIETEMELI